MYIIGSSTVYLAYLYLTDSTDVGCLIISLYCVHRPSFLHLPSSLSIHLPGSLLLSGVDGAEGLRVGHTRITQSAVVRADLVLPTADGAWFANQTTGIGRLNMNQHTVNMIYFVRSHLQCHGVVGALGVSLCRWRGLERRRSWHIREERVQPTSQHGRCISDQREEVV